MLTEDVENYPGFARGITGPDLVQEMRDQAERFGTTYWTEDAEEVDLPDRPFRIVAGGRGSSPRR